MHRALLLALTLALPGAAWAADDCSTEIHGTDQMMFDKNEIVVPASCKSFKVTLKHPGTLPKEVMGHNWVLTEASEMQAVANDGVAAGVEHDYLKPDDSRIIAHTKLLSGGEQDSVTIDISKLKKDGSYEFFCSYPAHSVLMKGRFKLGS